MKPHRRINTTARPAHCSTDGCTNPAVALGKCGACYQWAWHWQRQQLKKRIAYVARQKRTAARVAEMEGAPRLRLVYNRQ